jgi:hypothetical protein
MVVIRAKPPMPSAWITLHNPVPGGAMAEFCRLNREWLRDLRDSRVQMVKADEFHGKVLALCGAGPSLGDVIYPVDEMWGCNSAAGVLRNRGITAAIGIDQTPGMMRDWADPVPVTHYIATTCDPALVQHVYDAGVPIRFFHNLVGWGDGEIDYYNNAWPPAYMVATGATVVGRMIALAAWMGFRRIDVYGADCSFGMDGIVHANGENLDEAYGEMTVILEGEVGGRKWRARPDMLMSAVDLVRKTREAEGRVRLMGDTLPVALLGFDDDYLDEVIRRLAPGEMMPTTGDTNG